MIRKELHTARSLWPLLRIHPWAAVGMLVLGFLASLSEGIGIGLFIPLLHNIVDGTSSDVWIVRVFEDFISGIEPDNRVAFVAACIMGAILLKASLTLTNRMLFNWLDARIGHHLRSSIVAQLLSVDYGYLREQDGSRLFNTLSTETWRTGEALSLLVNLCITSCTLVVYAVLMVLISWKWTIIGLAAMVVISLIVHRLTRRAEAVGKDVTKANVALTRRMWESLMGMKLIRILGQEKFEQQRFDEASTRMSNLFMTLNNLKVTVSPVFEVLATALLVAFLLVALSGPGSLAAFLVFIFVLYRLQPQVRSIDSARVGLASHAAAVDEVTALMRRDDKEYVSSGDVPFERLEQGIEFDDITFRYGRSTAPALKNVTLEFGKGKTTALVGPSGAGKSTTINLLARLYDPTEGRILIDGRPLEQLDLRTWRRRIALVSQEVFIFNATVAENIAYGKPDAKREEIIAAAERAHAHEFVQELSSGYDTLLGDEGVRLSGGQEQRLALARALIREPDVLILDEATNALDAVSESLVQDALAEAFRDRTVIVIAHRLSTIELADHIIVLEDGHVREQGTPEELLAGDRLFARLYRLESRGLLGGSERDGQLEQAAPVMNAGGAA